jgi:hypothetical protein
MRKYHARFLEGWATARSPGYSAMVGRSAEGCTENLGLCVEMPRIKRSSGNDLTCELATLRAADINGGFRSHSAATTSRVVRGFQRRVGRKVEKAKAAGRAAFAFEAIFSG